jgi:hypothetical protein
LGKSKYYDAALSNLEKAKSCYRSAGLDRKGRCSPPKFAVSISAVRLDGGL